ncbi:MAG: DUF1622 domain-containing protein, partial [Candidatus Geothermincolia bacterium]
HNLMEIVSKVVDGIGVGVIAIGLVASSVMFLRAEYKQWQGTGAPGKRLIHPFESYRQSLGRSILIGLEFLIAGDIIRTVAVSPTFYNLGTLAILVVIRSFLSWGLSMEIEGRWPWQAPGVMRAPDGSTDVTSDD